MLPHHRAYQITQMLRGCTKFYSAASLLAGSVQKEGPMRQIADGIAHVSFSGGGMFLPARTPYDRQILVEHVGAYLQANGRVQVLVEGQRWVVQLAQDSAVSSCSSCGCSTESACRSTAHREALYCMTCAFAGYRQTVLRRREERERAGNTA